MLIYATHAGGRYLPLAESFAVQPEGKRSFYMNITNHCNCACTFCLRQKKKMAEASTLWFHGAEPTVEELKAAIAGAPLDRAKELVFCGFGEPTMRLEVLLTLLAYAKSLAPALPTRLNTNGLANLEYGEDVTPRFEGILDTISISLNASNAQRYYELTRAKYGMESFDGMLDFAARAKAHVPHVVLTIVDQVEGPEEIARCRELCEERGLTLRVRPYEAN